LKTLSLRSKKFNKLMMLKIKNYFEITKMRYSNRIIKNIISVKE